MNNFLGIGSGEFIVILIIAILVVGPEKMVELATKLGLMIARIRRMTNDATQEFRDALAIDEVKDAIQEVTNEVKEVEKEIRGTATEVAHIGSEAASASQEIQQVAEGITIATQPTTLPTTTTKPASQTPPSGGRIPQVILDKLGPPPAKPGAQPNEVSAADGNGSENAAPIKLESTTVIEKEEDFEPIELEDVQVYVDKETNQPASEETSK